MAFQHFEYDSPLAALLQGQQSYSNFRNIPQLLEQQKIANALNAYKQKYEGIRSKNYPELIAAELAKAKLEPEQIRSQIGLHGEQQKKLAFQREHPLYGLTGAAGQIGAAELLREHPELATNSEASKLIIDALKANTGQKQSYAELQNKRSEGYDWNQLTAETKNALIAQGIGMGIDPIKMRDYINQGSTIKEIAEKEGLDPENIPSPQYFPTTTTKTRTQQVQQVGAELDYMSSATTPIIKQYADTFAGISPDKVKDMLSNDPTAQKRFGQYIGALAIQTELANGRVLLAGGRSGIEIIRDLRAKSLSGIDTKSPIKMSKVAFEEAQNTIDKILQKGAKIRTQTGMNLFSGSSNEKENNDPLGLR